MTRIDDTSWLCAHVNVDFFQAQRYWKLPPSRKQTLSNKRSFMAIMAFSYIFLYTMCSLLATIRLDTMHTIRSYGNQFDVECTIKFRFHEEAYPFGLIDLQSIWDAKAFQIHWSICNTAARLLRVNWLSTRSHRSTNSPRRLLLRHSAHEVACHVSTHQCIFQVIVHSAGKTYICFTQIGAYPGSS